MKKIINWIFSAILLCGTMVFTSCDPNDDIKPIENLSEKIIGKWMVAARDGNPAPTNRKKVYTFVSATKAYVSASIADNPVAGMWQEQMEADVVINGNKITLTSHPDEHTTGVEEFIVTDINNTDFTTNQKVNVTVDGRVVYSEDFALRFEKVKADYQQAILGTWEGRCTSEGSVFDDGQEHRWQYKADGTYVYYVKDGDNWKPYANNTLNEYFVDGNLLCTRWVDSGQENREWWEITITGNKMNWTALRQNPDKSSFTATFEMSLVSNMP